VANSDGKAVAAVDLSSFAVSRHIRLEANPTVVISHWARPVVYAVLPDTETVVEIDANQLAPARRIRVGVRPSGVQLDPSGEALWVLATQQRQLVRIPVDRLQVGTRIPLPEPPAEMAFAPDDRPGRDWIAISLPESGRLALVSASRGRLEHLIRLGGAPGPVAFRRDGRYVLAGDRSANQLAMYDTIGGRLAVRLPLAVRPDRFCMKQDGGELYVAGEGLDAVVSVYPFLTEVGTTLLAGRAPGFLATAGPGYLLVANPQSNNVTVISSRNQRVLAVTPAGKEPCFIAVTPDDQFALVLNRESGDMAVLRIEAVASRRPRSTAPVAPMMTMIPVGSKPVFASVRSL
jgi:YVTN family beta-propeller protein